MRKTRKVLRYFGLLGFVLLVIGACSQEETSNIDDITLSNPMEKIEDSEVRAESLEKTNSDASLVAKTICDILGTSSPQPGNQYTFTYTSNISGVAVTWSVESGAISLISSTGTTATFQFASGFNGGSIKAFGTNGSVECSEIKSFRSISCPQSSCLAIVEAEPCIDFLISLNCANNVSSVDWEYSIGPYSHVSFGSSTNPNGNYQIAKSLHIPSGSWDNYYLVVFADITMSNGTTCSLSQNILLDCDSSGGNQ